MIINKAYLHSLLETREFKTALDSVGKLRPVIPAHTVTPDNTNEWKSKSAEQKGFDLCFNQFRRNK